MTGMGRLLGCGLEIAGASAVVRLPNTELVVLDVVVVVVAAG